MGTMYVEFKINSVTYNTTKGRKNKSIIGIFASANLAELFQKEPLYGKVWNLKITNHRRSCGGGCCLTWRNTRRPQLRTLVLSLKRLNRKSKKEKAVFKFAGLVLRFNSAFLAEPVSMFIKPKTSSRFSGKKIKNVEMNAHVKTQHPIKAMVCSDGQQHCVKTHHFHIK